MAEITRRVASECWDKWDATGDERYYRVACYCWLRAVREWERAGRPNPV
jgi:hypothetical protein